MSNFLLEDIKFVSARIGDYSGDNKLIVDRQNGVIKNIKIIGFNSDNKRRYTRKALAEAIKRYENKKVNINHPKNPKDPRDLRDRIGKFINVRFIEGQGIFGDLLYLKTHELAESVCEAAEREELNDVYGMSHNAEGEGYMDGDILVVEKITEVRHVDIVPDPATTKSLKEAQSPSGEEVQEAGYGRVYAASKRRSSKAKRKFVKAKSKSATKPTGNIREDSEEVEEEEVDEKCMEEICAILDAEDMDRDGKAQAIYSKFGKTHKKKDQKEKGGEMSESKEVKVDENVKALTEAKAENEKLAKEINDLKLKTKVRDLCESHNVKFEDSLVEDFAGLKEDAIERQIKRISAASKVENPKCPEGKQVLEGKSGDEKKSEGKLPEGDDMFNWLLN